MSGWWGVQPPPRDWWVSGEFRKTVTTDNTNIWPQVQPVDEEHVRRIVREELADILPVDVPDTLPENFE